MKNLKYFLKGLFRIGLFILIFPLLILSTIICVIYFAGGRQDMENCLFYKLLEKVNF